MDPFLVRSRTFSKTSCTFLSSRNDCRRFPTAHASGIDSSELDTRHPVDTKRCCFSFINYKTVSNILISFFINKIKSQLFWSYTLFKKQVNESCIFRIITYHIKKKEKKCRRGINQKSISITIILFCYRMVMSLTYYYYYNIGRYVVTYSSTI